MPPEIVEEETHRVGRGRSTLDSSFRGCGVGATTCGNLWSPFMWPYAISPEDPAVALTLNNTEHRLRIPRYLSFTRRSPVIHLTFVKCSCRGPHRGIGCDL